MGLLRMAARTAVVAGTATAVHGCVQRRQAAGGTSRTSSSTRSSSRSTRRRHRRRRTTRPRCSSRSWRRCTPRACSPMRSSQQPRPRSSESDRPLRHVEAYSRLAGSTTRSSSTPATTAGPHSSTRTGRQTPRPCARPGLHGVYRRDLLRRQEALSARGASLPSLEACRCVGSRLARRRSLVRSPAAARSSPSSRHPTRPLTSCVSCEDAGSHGAHPQLARTKEARCQLLTSTND